MFATDNSVSSAGSTGYTQAANDADSDSDGLSTPAADGGYDYGFDEPERAPGQTLAEMNQQTATLLAQLNLNAAKADPVAGPSVAGDPSGDPPAVSASDTDRIRSEYQVSDDPDSVVSWSPSGFTGWLAETFGGSPKPVQVTASEAALLDGLSPFGLKAMSDIKNDAFATAEARFPSEARIPGNDDQTDAFRHAFWNAQMTRQFGQNFAQDYGNAHERVPGNTPNREAMDLYNNEVGRRIASENPLASDARLADLVEQAVRDGKMVVLDRNGNLVPSNAVKPGETGHERDNAPALPGKAPAAAQS